jgi:hypothetical protein
MKPLIIIKFPATTKLSEIQDYATMSRRNHPAYEFLFISQGATLSIAHEGNITVTEVLKGE